MQHGALDSRTVIGKLMRKGKTHDFRDFGVGRSSMREILVV
jgi:hypothetical protein